MLIALRSFPTEADGLPAIVLPGARFEASHPAVRANREHFDEVVRCERLFIVAGWTNTHQFLGHCRMVRVSMHQGNGA